MRVRESVLRIGTPPIGGSYPTSRVEQKSARQLADAVVRCDASPHPAIVIAVSVLQALRVSRSGGAICTGPCVGRERVRTLKHRYGLAQFGFAGLSGSRSTLTSRCSPGCRRHSPEHEQYRSRRRLRERTILSETEKNALRRAGVVLRRVRLLSEPQPLADLCDEVGHRASVRRFANRFARGLLAQRKLASLVNEAPAPAQDRNQRSPRKRGAGSCAKPRSARADPDRAQNQRSPRKRGARRLESSLQPERAPRQMRSPARSPTPPATVPLPEVRLPIRQ